MTIPVQSMAPCCERDDGDFAVAVTTLEAGVESEACPGGPCLTDDTACRHRVSTDTEILRILSREAQASREQVRAALTLLEDGATVPFIARYRKELTGNLDEAGLRALDERRGYFSDLLVRRAAVVEAIESQGNLTQQLRAAIEACHERIRLEDLYLPYRPKRRTRAIVAMEKGIEPLARIIYQQTGGHTATTLREAAEALVSGAEELVTSDAVFAAVRDVIAEWIAEDAELRQFLREFVFRTGEVHARLRTSCTDPGAGVQTDAFTQPDSSNAALTCEEPTDEKSRGRAARAVQRARKRDEARARYRMYHDFRESVRDIPSHRVMAIRRGAREEILSYAIVVDAEQALALLRPHIIVDSDSAYAPHIEVALVDSYHRLMKPSIETEVKHVLRKRADSEAIRVCAANLENLLMSPPAGPIVVLGLEPGFRTGCKVAVVDTTGALLEHTTIYPAEPRADEKGAEEILNALIDRHGVGAVAIGNGAASRETHSFVRRVLARRASSNGLYAAVVSGAGVSAYSVSEQASRELPELDVGVRGAVSIARRLQDPLAELVKIDPRSLAVGQYQHDIDQRRLCKALQDTVESCVNRVGVDVNGASTELLRYVSGVTDQLACAIVEHRDTHGPFRRRADLLEVSGLCPKTFERAVGFLRIRDGVVALDNTGVHPESYFIVDHIARSLDVDTAILIQAPDRLIQVDLEIISRDMNVGPLTLNAVVEELRGSGRGPRARFVVPEFGEGVYTIEDLKPGLDLQGTVTNVANFGVFVDIGTHQDGLVHVSELSHRFVQDPREVIRIGDIVRVRVLSIDVERKRIALSIKAVSDLAPAPAREASIGPGEPRRHRSPHFSPDSRRPMPSQATTQVESSGAYTPGNWRRASSSSSGSPKSDRTKVGPHPSRSQDKKNAGDVTREVADQIRQLQERFKRQ